ncbi:MAG: BON domain-containing protein [Rhodoferax sp.]|uniref:BON domain-containing protein n=1 Tax=Rhodoferax sp. TaxID=50421 RepID=UPI00261BF43A|nr:BON domain-containing protein [Rhodoferax sp.]MDD2881033.1 BON domain-containing protein [Rhodoferax sp.]
MTTTFGKHNLTLALAGVMSFYLVGCNQTETPITPPGSAATVGTAIDDSLLTTRVKAALMDNIDIKSLDIKVETRKGEVMLSGFVDNQAQIDHAVTVARAVPGVQAIDNKVSLKGSPTTIGTKVDDTLTTTRVKTVLMADEGVKSADIAVITRNGEVQLSGFVNNQEQIDRALELSRGVEGVTKVSNEMSIKK